MSIDIMRSEASRVRAPQVLEARSPAQHAGLDTPVVITIVVVTLRRSDSVISSFDLPHQM
jgi:hypothetical protein